MNIAQNSNYKFHYKSNVVPAYFIKYAMQNRIQSQLSHKTKRNEVKPRRDEIEYQFIDFIHNYR